MNMDQYFDKLTDILKTMEYTDQEQKKLAPQAAVEQCISHFMKYYTEIGRILVVGNGGSAAIASHTAIDYMKNGGIQTVCFNEAALLTCYGNDYGYEYVFSKPISQIAYPTDTLVAISSSGKSPNILNAVEEAKKKGCFVITLSGFESSNPLRSMGDLNIYVPSMSYGFVELAHQIFLHMVLDLIMERKNECQ